MNDKKRPQALPVSNAFIYCLHARIIGTNRMSTTNRINFSCFYRLLAFPVFCLFYFIHDGQLSSNYHRNLWGGYNACRWHLLSFFVLLLNKLLLHWHWWINPLHLRINGKQSRKELTRNVNRSALLAGCVIGINVWWYFLLCVVSSVRWGKTNDRNKARFATHPLTKIIKSATEIINIELPVVYYNIHSRELVSHINM